VAGNARKRAMIAELTRLAAEADAESVLDFVLMWTESGKTLTQLADKVNEVLDTEIDVDLLAGMISRYTRTLGPNVEEQIALARKRGAFRLVDQQIAVVDRAHDKDTSAAARVQASARQWTAERWNRDELGQPKQQAGVQINIGSLHLGALRHLEEGGEERASASLLPRASHQSLTDQSVGESATPGATVQDAEVLSIEPATS
jgi:hypothetical protein